MEVERIGLDVYPAQRASLDKEVVRQALRGRVVVSQDIEDVLRGETPILLDLLKQQNRLVVEGDSHAA